MRYTGKFSIFLSFIVSNGVYATDDSVIIEGTYLLNSLGLVILNSSEVLLIRCPIELKILKCGENELSCFIR